MFCKNSKVFVNSIDYVKSRGKIIHVLRNVLQITS